MGMETESVGLRRGSDGYYVASGKGANRVWERYRVGLDTGEETMTEQQFKDECDVNTILKQFVSTGFIPNLNMKEGVYMDVSEIGDYRDAIERVRQTNSFFMELPSSLREQFKNDAAIFLDYVMDPANEESLEQMGLVNIKQLQESLDQAAASGAVDMDPPEEA